MSIWADIHRRSNGVQVRKEDTVEDDLSFFQRMFFDAMKIPKDMYKDMFPGTDINKDIKTGQIKELNIRIQDLDKKMKKLTKINNKLYHECLGRHT